MSYSSLIIPYGATPSGGSFLPATWARLEQEYQPSEKENATPDDIYQMMALAKAGKTSFEYITDNCIYATVGDDQTITVELDFYVWVSDMDLPYSLSAAIGTLSDPEIFQEFRSFDVPFSNVAVVEIPYIFDGSLTVEMPFIKSDGDIIVPSPSFETDGSLVRLSEQATVVLRANGQVTGYKHTLTIELTAEEDTGDTYENGNFTAHLLASAGCEYDERTYPITAGAGSTEKEYRIEFVSSEVFNLSSGGTHITTGKRTEDFSAEGFTVRAAGWKGAFESGDYIIVAVVAAPDISTDGYKIENLRDEITVLWTDENGDVQTDILDIKIPKCVQDLLTACGDDPNKLKGSISNINSSSDSEDGEPREPYHFVWYSTCNGEILDEEDEDLKPPKKDPMVTS